MEKIIHQIWINENNLIYPEHWKIGPQKWKETHPNYKYILWDKEKSLSFVKNKFPDYYETYISLPYVIQRCDMIRYMFLYEYGGIYCDLDNYPKENLEKFLNKADTYFVSMKLPIGETINNNLIITKKNMPIFLEILEHIKKNSKIFSSNKMICVSNTNGHMYIQKMINEKKHNLFVLPYEQFNPYSFYNNVGEIDEHKKIIIMNSVNGKSWYDKNMDFLVIVVNNIIFIVFIFIVSIIFIIMILVFCGVIEKNTFLAN